MASIYQLKEQPVAESPLLLFDCQLASGDAEHWSTHKVQVKGVEYQPRVVRHNVFEFQTAADQGIDSIPKVSVTLANADSHFSELERSVGWKGAKLTVSFLFVDLRRGEPASEQLTLFHGLTNAPDEITDSTFRITALNRLSMQRVLLPQVRLQRRCPWEFPSNSEQRTEALAGSASGKFSRFFKCGYCADLPGGAGNLDDGVPFTQCDYSRSNCELRGMFSDDVRGNPTRRFGGIEFVPSSILVRSYGEKNWHSSALSENEARYNDFVPLIYGTAWFSPPVVFARNDGNLTHMETLLGMGEMQGILKVLVNDVEIPAGRSGLNMGGTGWFNVVSLGNRTGAFNLDFVDDQQRPQGDPYGSMAYLSVVMPNQVSSGATLPRVRVLIEGLKVYQFATDGSYSGESHSNNPAWVLLDVLCRTGWRLEEIDVPSFARAAAYCDEPIETQDLHGNPCSIPRFQCNLVVQKRRSAADVIRGIRNGARLFLTYGNGGLLQLRVENTLALQQPAKPEGSNSSEILEGGWPSYEFGDGTSDTSGIARRANGVPSFRIWCRGATDTPNRFTVEFQDALNEYQQDSLSLVDVEDVAKTGQEVSAALTAVGISNFDQAARILKFNLDKSIQGNCYVEFETSVKAIGLQPGDIIALTYLKEGFQRQPFRILRISPGMNYRTAVITAQLHRDEWYSDTNAGMLGGAERSRQPSWGVGVPRPLFGDDAGSPSGFDYSVKEVVHEDSDGGSSVDLTVGFVAPPAVRPRTTGIPLVSLSPQIEQEGGGLKGDQNLYYGISGVDESGTESALSFIVRASVTSSTDTNSVTLRDLSCPKGTSGFHVYRGPLPNQLLRIASNQPLAKVFTDSGLPCQLIAPPDPNYDHANFYWRLELLPEYLALAHTASCVANASLQMVADEYRGMVVRITRGKGAGQERSVSHNSRDTLYLASTWDVEPDVSSFFVVAEAGWRFGTSARTSPAQFSVPNRSGAIIHISGRAANALDTECPAETSILTRWTINGAGSGRGDADVPPQPSFGLAVPGSAAGTLEVSGISFTDLTNTRTINAAVLSLYYWNELNAAPTDILTAPLELVDEALSISSPGKLTAPSFIQIDSEIMEVCAEIAGGAQYQVKRGVHGTMPEAHPATSAVYQLEVCVQIVPFVRDFFGSRASGSWSYSVSLPDARVASAELFVTNAKGSSETAVRSFARTMDRGLRTLSGGQLSLQIDGFLAIESNAVPELVVEASHSVRDVFAVIGQAPLGADIDLTLRQDDVPYCSLHIPRGATISNSVDGITLPPLASGSRIRLDVDSVGTEVPGSDLTVTIRL